MEQPPRRDSRHRAWGNRASQGGWVRVWRNIREHPFWYSNQGKPATPFEALLDLYMMANWRSSVIVDRGETIEIDRGQVLTSIHSLGDRFGWTRERVRNWASELENQDHCLHMKSDHRRTIITLLDYDDWQGEESPGRTSETLVNQTSDRSEARPVTGPLNAPIRRRSEKREEQERTHTHASATAQASVIPPGVTPSPSLPAGSVCVSGVSLESSEPDGFDQFWDAYPIRINPDAARREWDRLRPSLTEVLEAIEAQKETERWRIDRGRYIPHPDRWLREQRWRFVPAKPEMPTWLGKNLGVETPSSPTEGLRSRFRTLWKAMDGPGGTIIPISPEERVRLLDLSGLSEKEERVLATIGETPEKLVELLGTSKQEVLAFAELIDAAWREETEADGS